MGAAGGIGLQQMKEVDIRTVDRESLVDIRDVQVDQALPRGRTVCGFPAPDQEPVLLPVREGGREGQFC